MTTLPRRTALVALAASLVVGASGCGLFRSKNEVLIVGDSVTYQSDADIQEQFRWADGVDLQAVSGKRNDELLPGAEEAASRHPKKGVFMPGYNDVMQGKVDTSPIPAMMAVAGSIPCSVWLLIPTKGVYDPKLAEEWNQRVRQEAANYDNVHLVDDWARLVDNSPQYTLVNTEDGVHPNALGRKAVAEVMSKAVRSNCPDE